jgi:hypothetical protein
MSDMYEALQKQGPKPPVNNQRSPQNNAVPIRRMAKHPPNLRVANGKRDLDALSSAISQWLVPLLVKAFMAEQRPAARKIKVPSSSPSSRPLCKEGAVKSAAFKKV